MPEFQLGDIVYCVINNGGWEERITIWKAKITAITQTNQGYQYNSFSLDIKLFKDQNDLYSFMADFWSKFRDN